MINYSKKVRIRKGVENLRSKNAEVDDRRLTYFSQSSGKSPDIHFKQERFQASTERCDVTLRYAAPTEWNEGQTFNMISSGRLKNYQYCGLAVQQAPELPDHSFYDSTTAESMSTKSDKNSDFQNGSGPPIDDQEPFAHMTSLSPVRDYCDCSFGRYASIERHTDKQYDDSFVEKPWQLFLPVNQLSKIEKQQRPHSIYPQESLLMNIIAVLSMTFPLILLVATVMIYRVETIPSAFMSAEFSKYSDRSHIAVNIRDGRLVYITQIITFMGPILGGYIMSMYASSIAQTLRSASVDDQSQNVSDPSQLSVIAALCQASMWQHFLYGIAWTRHKLHLLFTRRPAVEAPRALTKASRMHFLIILLGGITIGAGSIFTLSVIMVNMNEVYKNDLILFSTGRALSQHCLDWDRLTNRFPCSKDRFDPGRASQLREEYGLVHGTSTSSAIHFVDTNASDSDNPRLAVLIPAPEAVPVEVDFRTKTIGIATECSFITSSCDLHYESEDVNDPATYFTSFNCSSGFHGVLGKTPVVNDGSTIAGDPDNCSLCYKPGSSLTFGYFVDPVLRMIYNTLGYNASTGYPSADIGVLPDDSLVNPLFLGVAARISFVGIGNNNTNNPDVFQSERLWVELAMRCKLTSFDVEYSRVGGVVRDVVYLPTPNGTVLEIFHGVDTYDPTIDSGTQYLTILSQASLQNSTKGFAQKFEQLFSTQVLGLIGGNLTPRSALLQQVTRVVLVALVPVWSLVILATCCLAYVILGVCILHAKRKKADGDRRLGDLLSTPGAVWEAFQPFPYTKRPALFDHSQTSQRRVLIVESADSFYHLEME